MGKDEDNDYAPKSLEECIPEAYNFDENFRKRATPEYPQEKWRAADADGKSQIDRSTKTA